MATVDKKASTAVHPLEPLSAEEMRSAVSLIKAHEDVPMSARFNSVALWEPEKERLRLFSSGIGTRPPREAFAIMVDRETSMLIEAVADLDEGVVRWVRNLPGEHPPVLLEEFDLVVDAVKANLDWRAALRKRGITDYELIHIDPLATGRFGEQFEGHRRVARAVSYVRRDATDNGYARPIEGVVAFVDLNTLEVFRVDDYGIIPIPDVEGRYDANTVPQRTDVKPLEIIQPEGPSFTVDGHEISWQRWRLRISLHPMEGLVLHTVSFNDAGEERLILHRASIAEMVVPYGETSPMHYWKNYFDAGEYGLGKLTNSLELGCDCLGEIRYFDAYLVDGSGEPYVIRNAICLHEEDYGILWKHHDLVSGDTEVRRSRRLVISAIHTVGNYEYGFFWYLYQDGTIQAECKLTGIVATMAVEAGERPAYSAMIADRLAAPHHQHIFCFRLDMDVDGVDNNIYEVDSATVPMAPDNPHGNAFEAHTAPLRSEAEAQRITNFNRSRYWKVTNPSKLNAVGEPVAYKLIPGHGAATLLAAPESSIAKRAGFARYNLWVTPYAEDERHAAGTYPYQHAGGAGLPQFTAGNRSIEDTDIVLWYCLGLTHFVRPEDWPVMPVEYAGFHLKPHGFFDRNPALDVPATPSHHCHRNGHAG